MGNGFEEYKILLISNYDIAYHLFQEKSILKPFTVPAVMYRLL